MKDTNSLFVHNQRIADANVQMVLAAARTDVNAYADMERFARSSANAQHMKQQFIRVQRKRLGLK